jgi:hypothetical protein
MDQIDMQGHTGVQKGIDDFLALHTRKEKPEFVSKHQPKPEDIEHRSAKKNR